MSYCQEVSTQIRRTLQPLWNELDASLQTFKGKRILLAVSGGPDSRALLEAIGCWKKREDFQFCVASVDHQTRDMSERDAQDVVDRARALGFFANLLRLDSSLKKDEGTLRQARYASLIQFAKHADVSGVITAHHLDDEAEGFVMDLLGWGGGASGAGMLGKMTMDGIPILRPFLGLEKQKLLDALGALEIKNFVRDPGDLAQESRRAQVRHALLPTMKKIHPKISERLARRSKKLARYEETLQKMARLILQPFLSDDAVILPISIFKTELMAEKLLHEGMKISIPDADFRGNVPQIAKIIRLLGIDPATDSVTLSGSQGRNSWEFDVTGGKIKVSPHEIRIEKK